jgi:hypothetical protein
MDEFEQLKQELADSAAISDIECMCIRQSADGFEWYVSDSCEDADREDLLKAMKYLAYRNLIEKHPDNKYWVRIKQ